MSLINDALKKAQKQRTGEAPTLSSMPSVGGESPQRIARRAKPAGFNTLMVRAGIGGAVVLVLALGGYFLLRDKPPANAGPVSAPAVSLPADAKQSAGQTPGSQQGTTVPPAAAPAFTLPIAKTEPPATKAEPLAPVVAKSDPVPPVAKQTPAATPQVSGPKSQVSGPAAAPAVQVSATPPPKLEPRAIDFIENIKVAGIRASATDPKVLMNDRVYRPGSMVSGELGLKLVEISANALTFEDDRGGRYTRTF